MKLHIIYFFECLILFLLGMRVSGRTFNPLSVFVAIWGSVTGLSMLQLSRWQTGVSDETLTVFCFVLLMFALAYLLIIFVGDRQRPRVSPDWATNRAIPYKTVRTLFMVWMAIEVVEVIYSGGIPIIWHLIGSGKTYFDFGIPSVHGLMNALALSLILICSINSLRNYKQRKQYFFIIGIILIYYVALLTRQVVISAAIEIVSLGLLNNPKKFCRILVPLIIFAVFAFGVLGNVRTGYQGFMYVSQMKHAIDPLFVGVYWVYMYLSMTVSNLNKLITGGFPLIGLNAFSGMVPTALAPYFGIDTSFFTADYLVTPAYNVSGFFVSFYQGFGLIGAIVAAIIYGCIGAFSYGYWHKHKSELSLALLAVAMQIIILSFFDNMLFYLPCSFQFVIIFVLFKCYGKPLDGLREENNERK